MASAKANEFLIKQLNINKEIVTFRWLSRELSIHVNVAKNELASFYATSKATNQHVYATYLLTGNVAPTKAGGEALEDMMDVDEGNREIISTRKIILVGENDLENAKGRFTCIPSIHVYSLSPMAIMDATLLGASADRVRPTDVSKGKAYNQSVGIVVSPDVKTGYMGRPKGAVSKPTKTQPIVSSSKATSAIGSKVVEVIANTPHKANPEGKKIVTLDWSKVKSKADKTKEKGAEVAKKTKEINKKAFGEKFKEEKCGNSKSNVKAEPDVVRSVSRKSAEVVILKGGTKRPSEAMSLSDSENDRLSPSAKRRVSAPLPTSKPFSYERGVKVKRRVLLSDDEDEKVVKELKPSKKGRTLVSDDEDVDLSLGAMMDLDDAQINCTIQEPVSGFESVSDQGGGGEILSDTQIPTLPKQKRKPKKVIPVGKNGLPKRRIVKSRKTKNAKGYMVTEDYSSYESVSESEQLPTPLDTKEKMKVKHKADEIAVAKKEDEESSSEKLKKGKEKLENLRSNSSKVAAKVVSSKKLPQDDSVGVSSKGTKANNGNKNLMSYFKKK